MVLKNGTCRLYHHHRLSKIFQPVSVIPKDAQIKRHDITSKSQKLMLDLGVIHQSSPGCFYLLPLGLKSLEKLIALVDQEMGKVGGQKMVFPTLTNAKLWKTSGRLETLTSELFKIKDRHDHEFILSPTHEEAASYLMSAITQISYKQLPLRLYQITSKFRDEMKPRFGLMRGKQFLMKDLYSFDTDKESALKTYEQICQAYDSIFTQLGVKYYKVLGSCGHMGGNLSHEYHFKADIGEDSIISCHKCNYTANRELLVNGNECLNCGSEQIDTSPGIEVGHTFFLGDKYSKSLKALFLAKNGKPTTIQMGSYGLGLSRIIAAAIEVLSLDHEIRWPLSLAPYNIIILPPKGGSKEDHWLTEKSFTIESLYEEVEQLVPRLKNNVLIDDRTGSTIGRRYLEAKQMGYPFIIVLGNKIINDPPVYELTDLRGEPKVLYLSHNDLMSYIKQNAFISI